MKNIALILASGTGVRCGLDIPKQFAKVNDKLILEYSVSTFNKHHLIDEIIVVTNKEYVENITNKLSKYSKVLSIISGGLTRRESSYNGVFSVKYNEANILIHDAARPLISEDIITECIENLKEYNAVCVTVPSVDTVFIVDDNNNISDIPKRNYIRRAQTPQCFKLSVIKTAHNAAKQDINCSVTDDCGLVLNYTNEKVYTILGSEDNIKITYPEDINIILSKVSG